MPQISIRRATSKDLDTIMQIVDEAKALLRADGSPQWQDGHPDRQMFTEDIQKKINWVLTVGDQVAGTATLQLTPEESYRAIDGHWQRPDDDYATIHRLAISSHFRGQHLSNYFISNLITVGRLQGMHNFRLDTHPQNQRVQAIAEHFGFVKCGQIKVEDLNDPRRFAFELNLN